MADIATRYESMQTHTRNAYTSVGNKGGTIPANKNLENLAAAINSIPQGASGGNFEKMYVTQTINGNTCTLSITSSGSESNAKIVGQIVSGAGGKLYIVEV